LVLALCCTLNCRAADDYLDWESLRKKFTDELAKLHDAGQGTEIGKINDQLNAEKHCQLNLPAARKTAPVSHEKLFATAKRSVLIVGKLYKCDKCEHWHVSEAGGFALTKDVIVTNFHVIKNEGKDEAIGIMTSDGRVFP